MRKPHLAKDIRCDFCEDSHPLGVFEPFLDKYICIECAKLGVKALASAIELLLPTSGELFGKQSPK